MLDQPFYRVNSRT